jgi:hypothetical protein
VGHVCQHRAEAVGVAGHFHADVEAFVHVKFFLGVF